MVYTHIPGIISTSLAQLWSQMLLVEKKWVLSQPGQGKKVMMTTGLFFTSHVGTEVAYEHSLTIGTSTQSFLSLLEIIRPLAKRTGERSSKGLALKTARPPANICPTCLKPSRTCPRNVHPAELTMKACMQPRTQMRWNLIRKVCK